MLRHMNLKCVLKVPHHPYRQTSSCALMNFFFLLLYVRTT
uniref:Uncharacterized protein n=1 Tax=Rhizophora mucronata TaxID=61149 RepID=A0A2P2MZH0_RHIMU